MQVENALLLDVEAYVTNFISEQVPKEFAYHDIQHTLDVVAAARELGNVFELSDQELEILLIAAWFHDTGYDKGAVDHESRSAKYAMDFLKRYNYAEKDLKLILGCILATRMPHTPETLLQRVLCDADLSHLGQNVYWDRCSRVRQEITMTKDSLMDEKEWIDFELDFISNHRFHTKVARELYGKQKERHIKQLTKQKKRLNPQLVMTVEEMSKRKKKKKGGKKEKTKENSSDTEMQIKQLSLGRGVETMYRTTYRTHVNLSSIADNKANIMLSINAIIISIVVSTLAPRITDSPNLIIPTIILLAVCMASVVFATLSTRPKVTEGKFTIDDIKEKKSNLLFFGNFYNMDLDDFQWGMNEMIKDPDFLYSSMTRDLYFLGIVLAKKYQFLRICYNIFMYGLVLAVIAFTIAFMFSGK